MDKVVSRDGTTIAYKRTGDGPPVVLVNGALRDHKVWDALVPDLAKHCATYVFDRRGRGQSGDAPEYVIQREIEDIEAVIGAAGGKAVVFGGSSGANLALHAAVAGASISKLALHEPFFRPAGYSRPPDNFTDNLRAMIADGKRSEAIEYWSNDFVELSPEQFKIWRRNPDLWTENLSHAHTLVYDAIACTMRDDYGVPADRLASFTAPSLVINSDNTSDWLRAAAAETAAALPNCEAISLPGGWHWVKPGLLAELLTEFVTGIKPG